MKITVSTSPLSEQKKEALIVFFQGLENTLPSGNAPLKKQIDALVKRSAFKGEAGQCAIFPISGKQIIVTGVGEAKYFYNGLLEQAAATAVKVGKAAGLKSFAVASEIELTDVSSSDYQLLVGRGAAWGTYAFSIFKSGAKKPPAFSLSFCGIIKDRTAIKAAQDQGVSLLSTADLANLPGNEAPRLKLRTGPNRWQKKPA